MEIDIGDLCTHCGRDTSFGSGESLFVNRIPSGADGKLILANAPEDYYLDVTVNGYMCVDCQSVECDECNEDVLDYYINDGQIICTDCQEQ